MRSITLGLVLVLGGSNPCHGADVLFEDTFTYGLSARWQVVGLDKKDYRIKEGGLEMRVQNRATKKDTPMLKVVVPFGADDIVTASVTVTPLDAFTAEGEYAGLHLTTNGSREFAAKKQWVKDRLVFAPGEYVFKGMKGEEGDVEKYEVNYTEAAKDAGPLRVVLRGGLGFFMVGPSAKGEYQTFFHSALQKDVKERGFALSAAGAPGEDDHWVRFTDFKVVGE